MKNALILGLFTFVCSAGSAHANCDDNAHVSKKDAVQSSQATAARTGSGQLNLKVEKMSCMSCQTKMQGALEKLDGFKTAKFDIKAKTLSVDFDATKLTEAQVLTALEGVGFPAKKL